MKERQQLPLEAKEELTRERIMEWYDVWDGMVYVSFSGGKDSTVLLHLVREIFPDVPAVFINTGVEFPEVVKFVRTVDNVVWIRPRLNYKQVIDRYGYPIISKENSEKIREIRTSKSQKLIDKRLFGDKNGNGKLAERWKFLLDAPFKISDQCCYALRKSPIIKYENKSNRKPFLGLIASESSVRTLSYLRTGCNNFDSKRPVSSPMGFWMEEDVWYYIYKYKIPYSKIYSLGYERTGCMYCMFGVNLEKRYNRFQRLAKTHPKCYNYFINILKGGEVLDYLGVKY